MSQETITWLNTNTLIGFTSKRGHAWHYRAEAQGEQSNHYELAVPVEDVEHRLFGFDVLSRPLITNIPASMDSFTDLDEDGNPVQQFVVPGRQVLVRSDNAAVLGIFKSGYQIHQYREWLLTNVAEILNQGLEVGSAGLLKGGAVAWVSVEVPDTITTPEGVAFRPHLLAATSCDGTLATTYKPVVQNVVCDNTMSAGLAEAGAQVKVRHSSKSLGRVEEVRDALGMVHLIAERFAARVGRLAARNVTPLQWSKFVDVLIPVDPESTPRSQTMATNKRDALQQLWTSDPRVEPWKGTAWGVLQAVNTFTHHEGIVRGSERGERNMERAVRGGVDALDAQTLKVLDSVLA